ncbi:MAG: N-formylglutamate amidohydrolase [Myxococcota bacterium]
MRHDAFEIAGQARAGGVVFTCEHASNRVPAPWRLRPRDRALLATHWGYDIGARSLTLELARLAGGAAALSRFSRLLIDPNRDPADPTAVLAETDDGAPSFNRRPDVTHRATRFHAPFHHAVDRLVARRPRFLMSIHSFTPRFRGNARAMEAGVLFDRHDDHAEALLRALRDVGLRAEPNAPYSGKDGLIYSANRHGTNHAVPYLEIEVRQDLIASERHARQVARQVWRAMRAASI